VSIIEIDEKLIAPCGLYCGWCPFYVFDLKDFKCPGCWMREECAIRDCAADKGLKLCTFCENFPCEKLYNMYRNMDKFFNDIKSAMAKFRKAK